MILLDLSQTIISNAVVAFNKSNGVELNEDTIRFMVLNSIGSYRRKFVAEYGELIICADSHPSWRKNIFPYYKAARAKSNDESKINWVKLKEILNTITDEIDENFPYRVVRYPEAEGDDVIGVLAIENSLEVINNNNKILICSADHDLVQLQKFPNVEQYDPVFKKSKVVQNRPYEFLKEHIIRGDRGDGIPNILSNDDSFVMNIRQSQIRQTKLDTWLKFEPHDFCDERMLRNYKRNEMLIDLTKTPEDIKEGILKSYEDQKGKSNKNILPYMIKHKLGKLMNNIMDY